MLLYSWWNDKRAMRVKALLLKKCTFNIHIAIKKNNIWLYGCHGDVCEDVCEDGW